MIKSVTINGKTYRAFGASEHPLGLVCRSCPYEMSKTGVGKCDGCGKPTHTLDYKLCADCSSLSELCAVCTDPITDRKNSWKFFDD